MPNWLKSWILRRNDNDACLMTGEGAYHASCLMTGATWRLMRHLEKRTQELEAQVRRDAQDLNGEESGDARLF